MFNLKWNNGGNYCESFFFFHFPPTPGYYSLLWIKLCLSRKVLLIEEMFLSLPVLAVLQ